MVRGQGTRCSPLSVCTDMTPHTARQPASEAHGSEGGILRTPLLHAGKHTQRCIDPRGLRQHREALAQMLRGCGTAARHPRHLCHPTKLYLSTIAPLLIAHAVVLATERGRKGTASADCRACSTARYRDSVATPSSHAAGQPGAGAQPDHFEPIARVCVRARAGAGARLCMRVRAYGSVAAQYRHSRANDQMPLRQSMQAARGGRVREAWDGLP